METFENLGLAPELIQGIQDMGFQNPMPIQEHVIPALLDTHEDLIGLAQTGTGKTAAFGLPLVQLTDETISSPQALILAPTRELCLQIAGEIKQFAKYRKKLHILAVYGGTDIVRQIRTLNKGVHILVATPGRMNDLLNKRKEVDFSALRTVVLDEADEMLNMGFKEELDAILEQTPETRQTLLFSATMPKEVLKISREYMREPREITVGKRNAGAEDVTHQFYPVRSKDRYLALKRVVDYHPEMYGIVFCRTRLETKEVADKLIQDGYNAEALHGDLSQAQREYIMHKFRIKNLQILVATDVAARGLDVKDVSHIINYNLPDEDEVYIHRSGRTGRAGREGVSIAIVNLKEQHKIKRIEAKLNKTFERCAVPGGQEICEKQLLHLVDRMQKIEVDHKSIDKFLPVIYEKLEWLSREELIKHFVSLEFNRFLEYYKDAEDLNVPEQRERRGKDERRGSRDDKKRRGKDDGRRRDRGDEKPRGRKGGVERQENLNRRAEAGFTRFHINLGFKDSLTPLDVIGLINRCTRKRNIDIGRIDLMKSFSFFEVDENYTHDILSGFRGVEYNRREVVVQIAQEGASYAQSKTPKPERKRSKKKKNPQK